MTQGTLYGVGVGPGDPELLTIKAAMVLKNCDVIAVPQKKEKCFAYSIVLSALPELENKPVIETVFPMTRDKAVRERAQDAAADMLAELLDNGRDVVFVTIGDPTVYSTYGYLHRRIVAKGYNAEIVPGITSFCAAAASLGMSLCEDREELHIIPGGANAVSALEYPDTKVFMKGEIPSLIDAANKAGKSLVGAENCTTDKERLYRSAEEIPADAGYYTLIIAKEKD